MEDKNIFEKEPQWEPDSAPVSEIRKIQKTIRRRNWKIISVSVILAVVLLLGSVFGIVPMVERLYWNPDEITYRDGTDLEITLQAYTELFSPGYRITGIAHHRTGFASYDLEILLDTTAQSERLFVGGTLERNTLNLDEAFLFPEGKNYPLGRDENGMSPYPSEIEALRKQLGELPDYVRLEATVTFPEDLSMEELVKFYGKCAMDPILNPMQITWVGVRTGESGVPFCGMSIWGSVRVYNLVDLEYRCFSGAAAMNQESLEHHFKSLLRYSADQVEKGRGIVPHGHEGLYDEILDYVEENGVKACGVVVTATPQSLLKLMDSDQVHEIRLVDGWINIG